MTESGRHSKRRFSFAAFTVGWNWTLGKDKQGAGVVLPTFYSLSGEELAIPKVFHEAIRAVTKAVNCIGCVHCHFAR